MSRRIVVNGIEITVLKQYHRHNGYNNVIYYKILCPVCKEPKEVLKVNLVNNGVGLRHRSCAKRGNSIEVVTNIKFDAYTRHAIKLKLDFSLTKEQIRNLIFEDCFYCGQSPNQRQYNHEKMPSNGIDRVNNKIGYIIENCVSCCKRCNTAKGKQSKEDFLSWIENIYLRQNKIINSPLGE